MTSNLWNTADLFRPKSQRSKKRVPRAVIRQVENLEERTLLSTFTVTGHVQWTDGAGGFHPAPLVEVEIHLLGAGNTDGGLLATGRTNLVGDYEIDVNTGAGTEDTTIFTKVLSRSPVADVGPTTSNTTYAIFSTDNAGNIVSNGGSFDIDVTADNTTFQGVSFSVNNSLVMISQYISNLVGWAPSTLDVRFDATIDGSYFVPSTKQLFIRKSAGFEWDPIQHEFGHYVMNQFEFQANPGGSHSSDDNLSDSRGSKAIGIPLAWGEGWPTFFGTQGQVSLGAASYGIPEVGDVIYQAWGGGVQDNLETQIGLGEDNEASVMSVLWDIVDTAVDGLDNYHMTDYALFNALVAAKATTLADAWEALAGPLSNSERVKLGAVFAQNNVAPNLQSPADGVQAGATPPTFTWLKNGGGTPNPNDAFIIKFYTPDMSSVVFQKSLEETDNYTPTNEEWADILSEGPIVKWVVEGRNGLAPPTPNGSLGYYWSQARTIGGASAVFVIDDTGSMGEEIGSVVAALQDYIDLVDASLPEGVEPPAITLITFKDNVTVRLTSNDLDEVRSAVASLFASGGGDCPEASAEALLAAVDFVSPGGTVLLATDASAHPGSDFGPAISRLRAKGATVNVILSGDCGPIESESSVAGPELAEAASPAPLPLSSTAESDTCGCSDTNEDSHCNGAAELASSVGYVAGSFVKTGKNSTSGVAYEPSPDGSDIDVGPEVFVDDDGQAPIDDHGNTPAEATQLTVNGAPLLGVLPVNGDEADVFKVALEGGSTYFATLDVQDFNYVYVEFLGPDGTTLIDSLYVYFGSDSLTLNPDEDGTYYLRLTPYYDEKVGYYISVSDPAEGGGLLSTSAVELFSTIAAETGGAFLVRDDVNFGDSDAYTAALFNVFASSLGPVVLSATPDSAPSGETVAVSLTGKNTNWHQGSTSVSFSNSGLMVQSVTVTSATTLTAIVQINGSVLPDLYDATVTTTLGGETETAFGANVLAVTDPIFGATLLSADPSTLSQGTSGQLTLYGADVTWTNSSTVTLGSGITVNSVTANTSTRLTVNYTVAPDATIGFRTATVTSVANGTVSLSRALFVQTAGVTIPEIVGLDMENGAPGSNLTITVTGANTNFVNGQTTADFGEGIQVLNVNVTSPTTAVINIAIASGAGVGFRNVTLTTAGETATLLAGFFVGDLGGDIGGNVSVTVGKGTITLTGDDSGNHVLVTIIDKKTIRIQGQDGTTINGQTGPINFSAKTLSVINLGGGNDVLRVVSNRANAIKKSASINMGSGNDEVRLEHLTIKGRARLTLGAGADHLVLLDTVFSSQTTVDFVDGEDTFEELASIGASITARESRHIERALRKGRGKAR